MPSDQSSISRLKLTGPGVCTYKSAGVLVPRAVGTASTPDGLAFLSEAMWLLFSEHPQRSRAMKGMSLGECPAQQMEPEYEWSHQGEPHCPIGHDGRF